MAGPIGRWLHGHDPEWNALHKAIKVSVVTTTGLALGTLVIGSPQLSTFAAFGGIAMLLFAEFPGGRSQRLGAYIGLTIVGAALIALGTLASDIGWLAVVGMAVVGFLVLFGGLFSATAAGGTRAALLAFILPVTVPGTASDIPARLGGWGIAAALAIPAAILIWPPHDHHRLRVLGAAACVALADQLLARSSANDHLLDPDTKSAGIELIDTRSHDAIAALRRQFRSTIYRPVGLTTGSRVLMQLPDRLSWLRAVIDRVPRGTAGQWPQQTRELVVACAEVLGASAEVLATAVHRPTFATRQRLSIALRELDRHRAQVSTFLDVVAAPPAGTQSPGLLLPALAHELRYTAHLAGETVSVSATADARPLLDRLIGRQAPGSVDGPLVAAQRLAAGHITRRSVWFQNSLRGALGLSIAVLIAEVTEVQHGFWIVLGTMSVLRTTALTTGSTALRALSGTLIGFLVGAGLILLVGTTGWHLWLLLPVVIMVAAYLPEAVSFVAGQAAFTVMVVILFNIIAPVGWTVGLLRIEDIALGCAAGLISGVLLWPRGAAAQIRSALSEQYSRSAIALAEATHRLVAGPAVNDTLDEVISDARAASYRLDDALRGYLSERGTKSVSMEALTSVSNGGIRLRLAAEAISGLSRLAPSTVATRGTDATIGAAGSDLTGSATSASHWFQQVAGILEHPTSGAEATVPAPVTVEAEHLVLTTFRRAPVALRDPAVAARAKNIWQASLYVDDVALLQQRLAGVIDELNRRPIPGQPVDALATA